MKERNTSMRNLEEMLQEHQIGKTLDYLRSKINPGEESALRSRLDQIASSYKYLCHYYMEGVPDANRSNMIADMEESLRTIADGIERRKSLSRAGAYYAGIRMSDLRHYDLASLLREYRDITPKLMLSRAADDYPRDLMDTRFELLDSIFTAVMVSYPLSDEESKTLGDILTDPDADHLLQVQTASALVMGMLAWYDITKLSLLTKTASCDTTPTPVKARAFAGILFTLMACPDRVEANPAARQTVQTLLDCLDSEKCFRETITVLTGTYETDRLTSKMKDEVMPELMKLKPDIMNAMKNLTDKDPESLSYNPVWEEMLDKSGLTRKFEEMQDMLNNGADIMMLSMPALKNIPFFRTMSHWFLPFDIHNPELALPEGMDKKFSRIIDLGMPFICDCDIYSIVMSTMRAPQPQRDFMLSQFDAQLGQMEDDIKTSVPNSSNLTFTHEVVKYIRNMYRFFKLGHSTEDFFDPFSETLDLLNLPVLSEELDDTEFLEMMAEYYMKHDFYKEALPLFRHIGKEREADSALWQKIGFCLQKGRDFAGARDAYMKSELCGDSSQWLIKKLAFVNKKVGDHRMALEYYERALESDNENFKLILNAANAALECDDSATALKHFYHADYLRPDMPDVKRAIAWTEMLNGNLEKSEHLYSELLLEGATASDWLNAGHVAQLAGNKSTALKRYKESAKWGKTDFEMAYTADMETLEKKGADRDGLLLMLDAVMYPID